MFGVDLDGSAQQGTDAVAASNTLRLAVARRRTIDPGGILPLGAGDRDRAACLDRAWERHRDLAPLAPCTLGRCTMVMCVAGGLTR